MTVRVYQSTDTGAPTLNGVVGSLTTLLDAVLVNGYNTNNPAGAGWTIAFTTTNIRAYQQGSGSNGFYLRVNDSGAGAGDEAAGTPNAQEARVRGYMAMTGVSTGTSPFPTVAQMANGTFVRKSAAASVVARTWIAIADQRTLYLFILSNDTTAVYTMFAFGEFYSLKTSDPGRCMIMGRGSENTSGMTSSTETPDELRVFTLTNVGHYLSHDPQGSYSPTTFGRLADFSVIASSTTPFLGVGLVAYKNPADSQIYVSPVSIQTSIPSAHIRGRMRGFWHFCHPITSVTDGETFTSALDITGKTFRIIKAAGNGGLFCMETSDTWETN